MSHQKSKGGGREEGGIFITQKTKERGEGKEGREERGGGKREG